MLLTKAHRNRKIFNFEPNSFFRRFLISAILRHFLTNEGISQEMEASSQKRILPPPPQKCTELKYHTIACANIL